MSSEINFSDVYIGPSQQVGDFNVIVSNGRLHGDPGADINVQYYRDLNPTTVRPFDPSDAKEITDLKDVKRLLADVLFAVPTVRAIAFGNTFDQVRPGEVERTTETIRVILEPGVKWDDLCDSGRDLTQEVTAAIQSHLGRLPR